ncbi:SBBP repeat-containing protein [Aequorivita viscosa]|nr:SBBP repeat-containing protein [Aequorivita viscosa]
MKHLIIFFLLLAGIHTSYSQNTVFEWTNRMGGSLFDNGNCITTDANGNVYTIGQFQGTVDFDPGAGTANLVAVGQGDIFIQKLDASGNFLWAKQMGGPDSDFGKSITTDAAGNVYITGSFRETVDFDPGVGTFNLTSAGWDDIFIQKLDSNGNFLWAKQMGAAGIDAGYSITLDATGNVYTTGYFEHAIDFDPGAGTNILTSAGGWDIFIQKLDADGNFIWAKQTGGIDWDNGFSIIIDATGNILTTGNFQYTVDFDPGAGTTNLTAEGSWDIFIQKLDADGNFLWAKQMGGPSEELSASIATDTNGNVYITGYFQGTVDFDPGSETSYLTSSGGLDAFIQKLDVNGNFLWVKQLGSTGFDEGKSIVVDANGNVYVTGYFSHTVDFDPGAGVANLTSEGGADIFILKLDTNGDFVWANRIGGSEDDTGNCIFIAADGYIFTTGDFRETADFDPGPETSNLTSAGLTDIFILKLSETTLGIPENTFPEKFEVYPNPTNGKFTIDLGEEYRNITVEITNIVGQLISSEKYVATKIVAKEITSSAGIYFVKVATTEGLTKTLKLIKN